MIFEINGYFYIDNKGDRCRKYLDITLEGAKYSIPQLMVVMMNPGSSTPLNHDENGHQLTPAAKDPTQNQIIEIMKKKNINFARILNLSDLREPSSTTFYSKIKYSRKDTEHSIFDISRKKDLEEIFIKDVPVIFAWGVNPSLSKLANLAVEGLKKTTPLGILKNNNKYYHARPRFKKNQKEWVDKILEQMDSLEFY